MSPRVALVVAGLAALALPLPSPTILGIALTATGLVALTVSATSPGSSGPAVLIVAAALSWLTSPHDDSVPRLVILALALAAVHSAAALAAVVPSSARVPGRLTLRWAGWTAAATAGGVLVTALPGLLPAAPPPVLVTGAAVGALLSAVAVAAAVTHRNGVGSDRPPDARVTGRKQVHG
ncbi:hypothetical protein SAMN05661080_01358 [Modestobacter sp. DSM 44400]|uniref:hypothetical protein n=1 Tax=Modestobacter sp. DSM 44400 TaxID=1550230 RepID=UPI00089902E3|nr:hypothetical protein [Modestobacter sp. DSM 44400]SDX82981.1 hypothetical protein SAMN05661080_01358 [Modestobacter sp. DSM 44400]